MEDGPKPRELPKMGDPDGVLGSYFEGELEDRISVSITLSKYYIQKKEPSIYPPKLSEQPAIHSPANFL